MIVAVFTTVTVKICGITVWDGKKLMTVPWGRGKAHVNYRRSGNYYYYIDSYEKY